jgi:hypothetical protein
MAALTELFGGPKVSAGFTWDEDTWQKAKPLFQQAAQRFREAFKDVAEVVSKMVNHLRRNFNWSLEMIDRARPYLRKFVEQVRAGTIRLEETPSGRQPATPGSPLEQTVMRRWRENRPEMYLSLEKQGALKPLAHVLVDRFLRAEREYLLAGMPMSDAREQAEAEWLLSDPENDRPNPLLDQITTS